MQPANWIHFVAQCAQLNRRQRQAGIALLRGNAPRDATVALLDSVAQPQWACPACHSHHLHRHGHAHGLQRWRCVPYGRTFAREAAIRHQAVNLRAGIRVQGAAHVQNVNVYHSRLRGWLPPFHGVATRYLPNYLGWRWILDAGRIRSPETLLEASMGALPHLTVT